MAAPEPGTHESAPFVEGDARALACLNALLEASPEAVLICDGASGRILHANGCAEDTFGYGEGALLGRSLTELLPDAQRHIDEARGDGAGRVRRCIDLNGRARDGRELPLEVSLAERDVSGATLVTVLARDVRDRRFVEEERARLFVMEREARRAAERERARLVTVIDNAPVGLLVIEKDADRMLYNEEFRRLLGGEVRPIEERVELFRHRDGRRYKTEELPSQRALRGETVRGEALRIVHEDETIPVLASAVPVRDADGEIVATFIAMLDVSSREALERFREEYVGLISHDLKNPLAGIMLRAQLLGRSLAERGEEVDLRNVRLLIEAGHRMSAMLDELRDVTRLEARRLPLSKVSFTPRRFLDGILERALPEEERARVRVRVDDNAPRLYADPARLERVVVNLLTNAVKYGDPRQPIDVTVSPSRRGVAIRVHNEGVGMTPEEAERAFEKHYRARGASRRIEGLGLGLYITRLLVEAHGGRIRVETAPGKGATFVVDLPVEPKVEGEAGLSR